jgi:hypothetical protein
MNPIFIHAVAVFLAQRFFAFFFQICEYTIYSRNNINCGCSFQIQFRKMSRKALPPHHHHRDTIGNFLAPENGYRGALERKGIQPKDHMKENRKELKLTQMKLKAQREEDGIPEKPLYKLAQFREVEARLYEDLDRQRRPSLENKQFLARGQSERRRDELAKESQKIRQELENKLMEDYREKPTTPRKASVPKRDEVAQLARPTDANFIARNKVDAISMNPRRREENDENGIHEDFGRVPRYLEERKQRWAEEEAERRRRLPDPDCPPGMTVMPDSERLHTLEVLQNSREEALQQLRKLPFVIETPTMRKKQEYLEGKLREIDNALAIFSKPKVYVAKDR